MRKWPDLCRRRTASSWKAAHRRHRRVYYTVVDHSAVKGHTYEVEFWDTSNDGIDNDNTKKRMPKDIKEVVGAVNDLRFRSRCHGL
jgi:hypothetical protein